MNVSRGGQLAAWALLLAGVVGGCAARLAERPAGGIDLSGRWLLDRSSSDNPRTAIDAALQNAAEAGKPRVSERRAGAPPRPGRSDQRVDEAFAILSPALERLHVEQARATITFRYGDLGGQTYAYGSKVSILSQAGAGTRTAGWDGDAFVVLTDIEDGPKTTERFSLTADSRLQVQVTIESPRLADTVNVRRLFDRDRAGAAEAVTVR